MVFAGLAGSESAKTINGDRTRMNKKNIFIKIHYVSPLLLKVMEKIIDLGHKQVETHNKIIVGQMYQRGD